jgi:hypothetical protein
MIDKVFSIDIHAPAQRVWDEITRTGGPIHPMFGTFLHGEFKVGSVISHRTRNGGRTFVMGEVLEVSPPTRLVHTFRFAMQDDPAAPRSEGAPVLGSEGPPFLRSEGAPECGHG